MIIRSSTFTRLSRISHESARIAREIDALQGKVTSGLEVERPSDAPERVGTIQHYESLIADYERWEAASGNADSTLSVADRTLLDLNGVLTEAWELALQMGSETYAGEQRPATAELAENLMIEAQRLLNIDVAGRHIFGGTAYDAPPYDDDLNYVGSAEASVVDVSDDVQVTIGFSGEELGLGEVLTSIQALQTALENDDAAAIRGSIDLIVSAIDRVSAAQTHVGAEQSLALDFQELSASVQVELAGQLSALQDNDTVKSIVQLNTLQTQYEIALQVTANSRMTSLFERL